VNGWRDVEDLTAEEFLDLPESIRQAIIGQELGEDPAAVFLALAAARADGEARPPTDSARMI
jgi:hypothetical protein